MMDRQIDLTTAADLLAVPLAAEVQQTGKASGLRGSGGIETERPPGANAPRRDYQWVILVARDQGELYVHLCDALRRDRKVQVTLDRRETDSRNPPWVNERLRTSGAVVIRIPV